MKIVAEETEWREALEVLMPGTFTTVQDVGRPGYSQFGVPESGPLDSYALQAANYLVGNEPDAAGLEVTHAGLTLRAVAPTVIAVAGADLGLQINGIDRALWTVHQVLPGDVISFANRRAGVRAYVAIAGGIDVPVVMGSRATYVRARLGGFHGRPLRRGDRLAVSRLGDDRRHRQGLSLPDPLRRFGMPRPVRVIPGPQADRFAKVAWRRLFSAPYVVTPRSDRMGYRLQGPPLPYKEQYEHVSDGNAPGSIQVPGDGQPIVLLADRQTTGGYAKIATVISADLDFLAHVWPGEPVTFRYIDVAKAHVLRQIRQEMLAETARYTGYVQDGGDVA